MKLLLDTHFLIWSMQPPGIILKHEQRAIERAQSLHVSAVSIWELRTKWNLLDRKGRHKGRFSPDEAIIFADKNAITIEALTAIDCAVSLIHQPRHRDPFDEMLLVHAQQLGAKLLTRDEKLQGHPLAYQP